MNIIHRLLKHTNENSGNLPNCSVFEEIPVAIFINGRHSSTVLLAPGNLKEYITGFLYTEQYVSSPDEIESIRLEKNRISVITTNIFTSPGPKQTILSGCGGSVSYIDTGKLPVISSTFSISEKELECSIDDFFTSHMADADGPSISCVCTGGAVCLCRYDINDEQALDRMIGAAFLSDISLSSTYCICSAIITSEIVRKCLLSGIPVILTTRHITGLAGEIGEKNGLSIGVIQNGTLTVFSHPERITR